MKNNLEKIFKQFASNVEGLDNKVYIEFREALKETKRNIYDLMLTKEEIILGMDRAITAKDKYKYEGIGTKLNSEEIEVVANTLRKAIEDKLKGKNVKISAIK